MDRDARRYQQVGISRWCLNCGKWLFRCQCRSPLPYCHEADVMTSESQPTANTIFVTDGQGRIF